MLDAGCSMLDARYWIPSEIGFAPTTACFQSTSSCLAKTEWHPEFISRSLCYSVDAHATSHPELGSGSAGDLELAAFFKHEDAKMLKKTKTQDERKNHSAQGEA